MSRMPTLKLLIGQNGTGKSTAMKKFLRANRRNLIFPAPFDKAWDEFPKIKPIRGVLPDKNGRPSRNQKLRWAYRLPNINELQGTHVIDLSAFEDDDEDGTGKRDFFYSIISGSRGFFKGGLYIDDFKNYIRSHGKLPSRVKQLLTGYRHRELDLFFAAHSFNDINAEFLSHKAEIYLFKSENPPNANHLKNFAYPRELMQLFNHVLAEAASNPHYCAKFVAPNNAK